MEGIRKKVHMGRWREEREKEVEGIGRRGSGRKGRERKVEGIGKLFI